MVNEGLAFAEVGDAMNKYAYNERGEVIEVDRRSADPDATVLVNAQDVTRRDGDAYWYKDLAVTNTVSAQYQEVIVDAVWSNLVSSVTGHVFVAKTPEQFAYDADGNLIDDGRRGYGWDSDPTSPRLRRTKNRLFGYGTEAPDYHMVIYNYDHMSRRIGKRIYDNQDNLLESRHYLYDGWNLIAETINNHK